MLARLFLTLPLHERVVHALLILGSLHLPRFVEIIVGGLNERMGQTCVSFKFLRLSKLRVFSLQRGFFFFFEVSELKRVSTRVEESRNISRDYVQFVCKYGGFKTLNDKLKIARKKNFSSRRLNYKQTEEYERDDDSF